AGVDRLRGEHAGRDVAAHPQAVLVRVFRQYRHQLRLHGAVDFQSLIVPRDVEVDRLPRLLFRRRQRVGRGLVRSGSVDDAGQHETRADGQVGVELPFELENGVAVVAEVARGGDAGGDVQQAVHVAQVRVHVPQAGED